MSVPDRAVIALDFPHHYAVHLLDDAHPEQVIRIPNSPEPVDSMYVKIEPKHAHPWVGAFARGFENSELISGVYSWPDPDSLAAVAAGYGYAGPADDPKTWVRLQPMPITDVRTLPEHKMIVFVDFTHIFAYGPDKTLWRSERLSWDGISITQVATNHIFGIAWDAMQDKEVEFALDVRNGQHTGGAKPWSRR